MRLMGGWGVGECGNGRPHVLLANAEELFSHKLAPPRVICARVSHSVKAGAEPLARAWPKCLR